MKSIFLSTILLLSLVYLYSQSANAAISSCAEINATVEKCNTFTSGKIPGPTPDCCTGLQGIAKGVASVEDKIAVCKCSLAALMKIRGVDEKSLSTLGAQCGVNELGFPTSLSADCEKVK